MTISSEDEEIIYIISASSASLSILGNLLIIYLFLRIKTLRLYVFRLVFYTAICDSFKSVVFIVPVNITKNSKMICGLLGYVNAYSSISGIVWVLAIAVSLNQLIIEKNHHVERYHKVWFLAAMVLPAVVSIFPFLTSSYGYSDGLCTLKEDRTSLIWKFCMFYLPSWSIIVFIIVVYVKVGVNLKYNKAVNEDQRAKRKVMKRIVAYPLIMVISFLPITCVRIIYFTTGHTDIISLSIGYSFYAIYGLLNSLVYGCNDIVIKNFKESFRSKHINQSLSESETF